VVSQIWVDPSRAADLSVTPATFGPTRFLNRELSWLDFAERLIELAEDPRAPLLERAKFLGIFSSGLDEFFQVRIAALRDQVAAGIRNRSADGLTAEEQLRAVRAQCLSLVDRQAHIFSADLLPALVESGVHLVDFERLDEDRRAELRRVFERQIFPVLTPLSVDPRHPFPYISNLSLNLAVRVEDPVTGESRFARVKVPPLLPRFVQLEDREYFVPLEQVIAANLNSLFPDMRVGSHYAFRVTRNAEIEFEESDSDDLLEAVEIELRRRRFGRAVRLEVDPEIEPEFLELLLKELELEAGDVYAPHAPIDLAQLFGITGRDRADLKDPAWAPMTPSRLVDADEPADIFGAIAERDILVHHPYDSFATSVEAFLSQAATDPDVLAIKQTLYRTSGNAGIVGALAQAVEAGKQVAVLVELTARFDEQRNIAWARQLERAGVHVVYGVVGLKVHAKTTLVVRREADGIRRYCHIGTGNYNADTARAYEDLGLFTADPAVGSDLTDLFNHLTGFSRATKTEALILAPERFRPWVLERIADERDAGEGGRIAIKVNGLTDPEVIDALYAAAQAGCRVDLMVRGMCSLRPGVPGLSESISVRSVVGRFLEHSRIYRFGGPTVAVNATRVVPATPDAAAHEAQYFIGSADLIQRNLDYRIEALVPVRDRELQGRLEDILSLGFADDTFAWSLGRDGTWSRIPTTTGISLHRRLQELAIERARHRRPRDG
jgi:polyphosphate kinase